MSNVIKYVPVVTPTGKPGKVGTVVAGISMAPGGVQQWMCDTVVVDTSPANDMLTVIRFVVVSQLTIAVPIPVDAFGGTSLAPISVPLNTSVAAFAALAPSISITASDAAKTAVRLTPRIFSR